MDKPGTEGKMAICRQLVLPNEISAMTQLAPFVAEFSAAAELPEMLYNQIDLALDEAVTNVVMYAYPKGISGNVTITAEATEKQLTIILSDHGVPFDPTATEDPDITLSAEERPIGGLGIFLVKQVMDTIDYRRTPDGINELTLRKEIVR